MTRQYNTIFYNTVECDTKNTKIRVNTKEKQKKAKKEKGITQLDPEIDRVELQNRRFHVPQAPQPTFLFPVETPLRLSRNMLHGWKDNSMLAKPLAA